MDQISETTATHTHVVGSEALDILGRFTGPCKHSHGFCFRSREPANSNRVYASVCELKKAFVNLTPTPLVVQEISPRKFSKITASGKLGIHPSCLGQ